MPIQIVTEGKADGLVVRHLLGTSGRDHRIVYVPGKSLAHATARKLLVTTDDPVLLVVDADVVGEAAVEREAADLDGLLLAAGGAGRSDVVLMEPEMEALFFQAPEALNAILGLDLDINEARAAVQPKRYLGELAAAAGKDWPHPLDGLVREATEQHWEAFRQTPAGLRVITAANNMRRPVRPAA